MRFLLALVPAFLLAQAPASAPKPAAPRPAAAKPKPATPAAAKPAAGAKPVARTTAAAKASAKPAAPLTTDDEKAIYALGLSIHQSLSQFDLDPAELEILKRALADAAAGKPAGELNDWGPKIQPFARSRQARFAEKQKAVSAEFAAKAAAEPGAVKAESGLVYREITPGTGASPKATDRVKVHYRGTLTNGTEFDSSYKRNAPAEFALNGVIPCWTEGVQKMKQGGKSRLVCPSNIAYGDNGRPPVIPGGATLVFEVELLEVTEPPAPPPAATDPPSPPQPPATKPPGNDQGRVNN